MAVAFRTFLKVMLAYMSACVADGVRDVECKVVASLDSRNLEKLTVLSFGKMLLQIEMEGGTSCQVFYVFASVQAHLVDYVQRLVFYNVEIAVIAVTRNSISVFLIPFCMLYTDILSRNHLTVEKRGL